MSEGRDCTASVVLVQRQWLERASAEFGDRTAVIAGDGVLSYAALAGQAAAFAARLQESGETPGREAVIDLPAGAGFVVALHAVLLAGYAARPLDQRLRPKQRADALSGASLIISRPPPVEQGSLCEVHQSVELDSVAIILETSGTSGVPKRVELTHRNWAAQCDASTQRLALTADDRWLCALPLSHVAGLAVLMRAACDASAVTVRDKFDAKEVAEAIASGAVTRISLVATMLDRVLDQLEPGPAMKLKTALIGGGPVTDQLLERANLAGIPAVSAYGMTETCAQVAAGTPKHPSELQALPGVDLRLSEVGEVLVRGDQIELAAVSSDGWLHTGDLAVATTSRGICIAGRRSDLIITGGENVNPVEVEAALLKHDFVSDAAVFALSSDEWGEAVCAAYVLAPGSSISSSELKQYCRQQLPAFKVPKQLFLVPEIPRNDRGKLNRRVLSERFRS